jgi:universal stress protein E
MEALNVNVRKQSDRSLDRILVVVDPDPALAGQVGQQAILDRAVELARATNARLELFHACYDPSLEMSLFATRDDVNREKEHLANSAATRMAELALKIKARGVEVEHEVRWDYPESDAILRKIDESRPDLVLKASRGPNYFLGLADNADWDLIRKSPCHLWLVREGDRPIKTVLSAIGSTLLDEDILTGADVEIYRTASTVAEAYGAQNIPVHSYQVPSLPAYAGYAPAMEGYVPVEQQQEELRQVAESHGQAVADFAARLGLSEEDIVVEQGHPAEVLPDVARSREAGLIVIGARHLGRWERLFAAVTAEPLLSEAPCDVLFVKERSGSEIPAAEERPRHGVPEINVEMAITHPEEAFKTPEAVVRADKLSRDLRRRILDAWKLDIQAELNEENEGGPVRDSKAGLLREIDSARLALDRASGDGTN